MNKNKIEFDPEKVGKAEFGWYKAHHLKDYNEVIRLMALVYEMLFGLKSETAKKIMLKKIEAAKEHDLAEEEGIPEKKANEHWEKGEKLMIEHFKMLKEALSETE